MTDHKTLDDILTFWFAEDMSPKWYMVNTEFDQLLRDEFGATHALAHKGELAEWQETREGRLALIIVLDQFSRNIYRDSAKAFAYDDQALGMAKHALRMGDDIWMKKNKKPDVWRSFLYMPFMHSENLEDQRNCVNLFQTHGPDVNLPYAYAHLDVIYRFGRFPSRNKALGRTSTAEEESFIMAST